MGRSRLLFVNKWNLVQGYPGKNFLSFALTIVSLLTVRSIKVGMDDHKIKTLSFPEVGRIAKNCKSIVIFIQKITQVRVKKYKNILLKYWVTAK